MLSRLKFGPSGNEALKGSAENSAHPGQTTAPAAQNVGLPRSEFLIATELLEIAVTSTKQTLGAISNRNKNSYFENAIRPGKLAHV
jgi:hypothetical protein